MRILIVLAYFASLSALSVNGTETQQTVKPGNIDDLLIFFIFYTNRNRLALEVKG